MRYAELEAIRREIADRQAQLLRDNQGLLTAAHKVKFAVLEESLRLQPVINEAQSASLLPGGCHVAGVLSTIPFPQPGGISASIRAFRIFDPAQMQP